MRFLVRPSTFEEVLPVWRDDLWPGRQSPIEIDNGIRMELPRPADVRFFAAKDDAGDIIGVISGFKTSATHYRVRGVYVAPWARRHGVAKSLYYTVQHAAIEADCTVIWSLARQDAFSFYDDMGFERVSEWDDKYEFGPNAFVEKRLTGYGEKPVFHANSVELTHGNHFEFGYNGQSFNFRTSVDDRWWVKYGTCTRKPMGFGDECLITARMIRDRTHLPIHVMFSGGLDSEVALRSFVQAGIPVTAAICRFAHDLNIHDISYAVIVCEALGVPYKFYDIDLIRFWYTDAYEYAIRTYAISPQLITTMWCADQIDGFPVMGSGEPYLVKDVPLGYKAKESDYTRTTWSLWEKEHIAAWYRHFMMRNREACPGFFQYTPEIMYSFVTEPPVVDLVNDTKRGKLSTLNSKAEVYGRHFSMIPRQKYTGFEKVPELDYQHRERMRRISPLAEQVHRTEYRTLLDDLDPNRMAIRPEILPLAP